MPHRTAAPRSRRRAGSTRCSPRTCSILSLAASLLLGACAANRPPAVPHPLARACRSPALALRGAWDEPRRRGVSHAFDALAGPPVAGPRLAARLDAQAAAWTKARARTCSAARHREITTATYTAVATCQHGVLRQHAALVDRIIRQPAATLERADAGVDELEDALRRCERPESVALHRGPADLLAARADLTLADLALAMEDGAWVQAAAHAASEPAVAPAVAATLRPELQISLAWGSWLRGQDQKASSRLAELGADGELDDHPIARARLAELRLFTRGVDDPEALRDGDAALAAYAALFGPGDRRLVRVRRELARRHRLAGRPNDAIADLEAALAALTSSDDDPLRATLQHELGDLEHQRGDYRQAALLHRAALDLRERSFGRDQLITADSVFALANDREALGELAPAITLYVRAAEIQQALAPGELPTARTYNNLGRACYADGNLVDAKRFHAEALRIRQRRLGDHHPDTATSFNNLGAVARAEGDLKTALELFQRALDIRERLLGPDHPYVAISLNNIAEIHAAESRLPEAIALHQHALEIRRARFGEDHPETARSLHNLAALLLRRQAPGDLDTAFTMLTSAARTRAARLGPDHPETRSTLERLAELEVLRPAPEPPPTKPPPPKRAPKRP